MSTPRPGREPEIDINEISTRVVYSESDDVAPEVADGTVAAASYAGPGTDDLARKPLSSGLPADSQEQRGSHLAQRLPLPSVAPLSAEDIAEEKRQASFRAQSHLQKLSRKRQPVEPAPWMHRSLQDLPVCVIDLETTGGSGERDEILEVGAVLLRGADFVREFSSLVDPQRPITGAAQAVHRISEREIIGAPKIDELLPWIEEMAENRVLLFHNAGFDLGFLQRALGEAGRELLRQPVVDTVVMARRLLAGRCGLGTAAGRLGIELPHLHRALADAQLTAHLWLELVSILTKAGATSLGEVPGAHARPPRQRRRRRPRHLELLQVLEAAIGKGAALQIAYRAARGLEPVTMQIRPLRILFNRHCRVLDLDSNAECDVQLDRIDQLQPLLDH